MGEYRRGQLRSRSGARVRRPRQALAIGLSEARRAQRKDPGDGSAPARTGAVSRSVSSSSRLLEGRQAMRKRIVASTLIVCLAALGTTACATAGGAAVGAGAGAAIGAGTGYGAGKGALIGAGVGAAAGTIYEITKH